MGEAHAVQTCPKKEMIVYFYVKGYLSVSHMALPPVVIPARHIPDCHVPIASYPDAQHNL